MGNAQAEAEAVAESWVRLGDDTHTHIERHNNKNNNNDSNGCCCKDIKVEPRDSSRLA